MVIFLIASRKFPSIFREFYHPSFPIDDHTIFESRFPAIVSKNISFNMVQIINNCFHDRPPFFHAHDQYKFFISVYHDSASLSRVSFLYLYTQYTKGTHLLRSLILRSKIIDQRRALGIRRAFRLEEIRLDHIRIRILADPAHAGRLAPVVLEQEAEPQT